MEDANNLGSQEREDLIKEKQELLARLEVIDQYLGMPAYNDFDVFKEEILLKEMEIQQRMKELELQEKQNRIDLEIRSADIQKRQGGLDKLLKERRDELDGQ